MKTEQEDYWHSSQFQLNMQEERQINNLAVQCVLSSNKIKAVAYLIKKLRKSGRKADPMIVFSEFDGSYVDAGLEDWKMRRKAKIPKSAGADGSKRKGAKGEADEETKEDTRPWYQRYMWVLLIGGMIVYNIITFDKTKLTDAMNAANQQANQGGNAPAQAK